MNILFVATVYNHIATFHKPFIRYFQEKGFTVHIAGSDSMGGKEELEKLGTVCHDISFDKSVLSKKNFLALNELNNLFKNTHFDLIHVHTPIAAFLVRYCLKNKKSQGVVLYTAHGFHFYKGAPKKNWIIYYTAEKLAARWTDHLITINNEDFCNAQKILDSNKISLVHGVGVEVEFTKNRLGDEELKKLKQKLGIKKDTIVIAYIAELNENKNHKFLLENWSKIQNHNIDFELLVIGTGDKDQELKDFVKKERLSGIHFLGYRRDITKLLQVSDIVALLSRREGLPKSIMEAMATSIPCIVTNTRGLRDLIIHNENGFVIDLGNDSSLVDAFITLGQSKQLRDKMGSNSRKLITPYLLDNVMEEYVSIYTKLINIEGGG